MQWIGIKAVFEHPEPEITAEIIAAGFFEAGMKGVVIESPAVEIPEGAFADDDLVMPKDNAVATYVPESEELLAQVENLRVILDELKLTAGFSYELKFETLDERDWAEAWKEHFYPVRLSERIVVKPSWREYAPDSRDLILEIDPGMAFGTGTHPTTALCVSLIEKYLQPCGRFLDIGCGSGILMLAAAKLGASFVVGVDNDALATGITCKNMVLNGFDSERYQAITGHLAHDVSGVFDFAAANILAPVIKELLPDLPKKLKKGGIAVFSGLLNRDRQAMEAAISAAGFTLLETRTEKDWIAIVGKLS